MGKSKILSILIITILLACTSISGVSAIQQNEFTPIANWSASPLYQGDSGNVIIQLSSTCGDELEFSKVGIHFSWMGDNQFYSNNVDIKIPSNGNTEFSAITYNIDSNAPVGSNSVIIRFDFREHHWYGWSDEHWEGTYSVNVHSSFEKDYNELYSRSGSYIIGRIANSNYEGPQARASISQASTEFDLAKSLANQGNWQEAFTHLTTSSNLVEQASAQEQEYKAQQQLQQQQQQNQQLQTQQAQQAQTIQQQWYIIGAIIVVVVVLIVVVSVVMIKKKNKN